MKEVLTKKFWQDVKKIFDEARADAPSEPKPGASSEPQPPPSPSQPVTK